MALVLIALGSACCASWTPCQEEALNERSSMPPVSVTMHPFRLPVALAELPLDGLLPDPALLVLLPQPAATMATTLTAATALIVPLTVTSSCPAADRWPGAPPAGCPGAAERRSRCG